eukprot:CAMPEP_0181097802 /NCGR_PEP_ID=MMETSP1071-20121207/11764_1 /TAXON_ID=35127 /ORGANISM="Thalassiosira sp., Strain NH16" /LENGTH=406 /DNA_ID=CAMNT_0023180309 /DNA_START=81 /DNA_END=1299 /DNA_ORIENTATION=-
MTSLASRCLPSPSLRKFTETATRRSIIHDRPSYGFSGAGFLGCYHVGVAAALRRQGRLPRPDEDDGSDDTTEKMPLLTGVSAGSMIAAAIVSGIDPEQDGMDIVLEATRRTRESNRKSMVPLDVLTPGFSLIDQVEGPFRDAMAKALGGYCEKDESNNITTHDIDPRLFQRRFNDGSLRIGLTDRRTLFPILNSYRYVDSFRCLEDVVAACMLSSYIPGGTGPLNVKDNIPEFLGGLQSRPKNESGIDASDRAGTRLKDMTRLGMVKHGKNGVPSVLNEAVLATDKDQSIECNDTENDVEPTYYWDGGLADMFPTFDVNTIIVSPLNGLYNPNPAICPEMPQQDEFTFRHCPKSRLGLNFKNVRVLQRMAFSSDDDELHSRFREGYDDTRRFLKERGQLRVFVDKT